MTDRITPNTISNDSIIPELPIGGDPRSSLEPIQIKDDKKAATIRSAPDRSSGISRYDLTTFMMFQEVPTKVTKVSS
jgi:hypothetical protein